MLNIPVDPAIFLKTKLKFDPQNHEPAILVKTQEIWLFLD